MREIDSDGRGRGRGKASAPEEALLRKLSEFDAVAPEFLAGVIPFIVSMNRRTSGRNGRLDQLALRLAALEARPSLKYVGVYDESQPTVKATW